MKESDLINVLQCPRCKGPINNELYCVRCERIYKKEDDIYELMSDFQLPLPSAFSDTNYLRYHEISSETNEYLYHNRNPLINWVNGAGYRQIIKMLRKENGLILECGCGAGTFLNFNQNIDLKNCVMLDIDCKSLRLIKERKSIGGIIHGSVMNCPSWMILLIPLYLTPNLSIYCFWTWPWMK